jgi:hypothetical protein
LLDEANVTLRGKYEIWGLYKKTDIF